MMLDVQLGWRSLSRWELAFPTPVAKIQPRRFKKNRYSNDLAGKG
jgi:hypothetical protein